MLCNSLLKRPVGVVVVLIVREGVGVFNKGRKIA